MDFIIDFEQDTAGREFRRLSSAQGFGKARNQAEIFRRKSEVAVSGAVEAAPCFGNEAAVLGLLYLPAHQGIGKTGVPPQDRDEAGTFFRRQHGDGLRRQTGAKKTGVVGKRGRGEQHLYHVEISCGFQGGCPQFLNGGA